MRTAFALLMLAAGAAAAPFTHDPGLAEEVRVRGGLPNFLAKLNAGGPVRIAYLGGSITAANGWRPKTLAWLRAQYPQAQMTEINAAISGTGSDYGACRVRGDVLVQSPDLIFLECRVNGGGGFERQSAEGIVRQVWRESPQTDICFVYTIGQWMLADLQAGRNTSFGKVMEGVANHYGIPSIDLGVEIARREKGGSLVFRAPEPVEGKLHFSTDGVHPGDAGHQVYCEVIARSMLKMRGIGRPGTHALPVPLEARCWETTALLPIAEAALSPGWTPVDPVTDAVYTDDRGRTHGMLRGAVKCERGGESITVKWNGTTVGFSDIPHGDGFVVEAVVDGGAPVVMKRVQTEQRRKYARFWYLPEQAPGPHTVVLTVKELREGQAFYAGQVLVVGTPL